MATAKCFRGGEEISSWALVKKSVKDISSYLNMKSVKEAEELLCIRIILNYSKCRFFLPSPFPPVIWLYLLLLFRIESYFRST